MFYGNLAQLGKKSNSVIRSRSVMVKNWCNVLSMEGVTVCGHHPECRVTHGPLQVLLFFGQIRPGADPGRAKKVTGPLLQQTSSSDRKATATNRMHSNDLEACGMKCCYFLFHSKAKFLTR